MARVEIYTSMFCGYCALAKRLLDGKSVDYEEFDVGLDGSKRAEMIQRTKGRTSVPQVFIDGTHVGGCDDLHALDRDGRLDPMLGP
ncbi:MAG TPA: glutaredoxin 3 [Allosphingosinicella sp.]|nr:glutaredoxin 3 [Allosphingosinicella sp.]